jgi:hypothetical protein
MDTLVRAAQTTVFAALAPAEREHAFMLIQRCPETNRGGACRERA